MYKVSIHGQRLKHWCDCSFVQYPVALLEPCPTWPRSTPALCPICVTWWSESNTNTFSQWLFDITPFMCPICLCRRCTMMHWLFEKVSVIGVPLFLSTLSHCHGDSWHWVNPRRISCATCWCEGSAHFRSFVLVYSVSELRFNHWGLLQWWERVGKKLKKTSMVET